MAKRNKGVSPYTKYKKVPFKYDEGDLLRAQAATRAWRDSASGKAWLENFKLSQPRLPRLEEDWVYLRIIPEAR